MDQNSPSRRAFLRKTAIASAGVAFLSGNAVSAVFNSSLDFNGYKSKSKRTTDLRKSNSGAYPVTVQGVIYHEQTQLPLANAKVEVWHLSPNSQEIGYRAHFYTNEFGRYSFITDFPDHAPQFRPRIQFRLSHNQRERFNVLIFNKRQAFINHLQWGNINKHGAEFYPQLTQKLGTFNVQFNQTL